LPSVLITTSRRTSNRVRSFARDLWSVLAGSERFNRGSMSVEELFSRILQSGARAALVISIWKGNPGELKVLLPSGNELLRMRIDSALLRRETNPTFKRKIDGIESVCVKTGSSTKAMELARDLGNIFDILVRECRNPTDIPSDSNHVLIWLEDTPEGKILWTHYSTYNGLELGPRIKISSVWRLAGNES
jgi:rRNA maturation protein Rpf1